MTDKQSKDVEMKDVEAKKDEKKEAPQEPTDPFYGNSYSYLKDFRV